MPAGVPTYATAEQWRADVETLVEVLKNGKALSPLLRRLINWYLAIGGRLTPALVESK